MLSDPVVLMQGALSGLRKAEQLLQQTGIQSEVLRPPASEAGSAG